MAQIQPSELVIAYTNATTQGGASGASAATSLGKWGAQQSVTSVPGGLFGDVSSSYNQASTAAYRCVTLWNNTTTGLTATTGRFYLSGTAPAPAYIVAVLDTASATALGSAAVAGNAGALITTEIVAPTSVTFPSQNTPSQPTDYTTGLTVGDMPPNTARFIWLRRDPRNSAAQFETVQLQWDADSGP